MTRLVEIYKWFDPFPGSIRLHARVRGAFFPFEVLIPYLPQAGVIVDVGCGFGLWAFLMAAHLPEANVFGYDPDDHKIEIAKDIAGHQGVQNADFRVGSAEEIEFPYCDLVSVIDVLYLVDYPTQVRLITEIHRKLKDGGVFLLKTMSRKPAWKYAINLLEETAAVRLLRITQGGRFFFRSEGEWQRILNEAGFRTEVRRLDRGYIHPHLLIVARKG